MWEGKLQVLGGSHTAEGYGTSGAAGEPAIAAAVGHGGPARGSDLACDIRAAVVVHGDFVSKSPPPRREQ